MDKQLEESKTQIQWLKQHNLQPGKEQKRTRKRVAKQRGISTTPQQSLAHTGDVKTTRTRLNSGGNLRITTPDVKHGRPAPLPSNSAAVTPDLAEDLSSTRNAETTMAGRHIHGLVANGVLLQDAMQPRLAYRQQHIPPQDIMALNRLQMREGNPQLNTSASPMMPSWPPGQGFAAGFTMPLHQQAGFPTPPASQHQLFENRQNGIQDAQCIPGHPNWQHSPAQLQSRYHNGIQGAQYMTPNNGLQNSQPYNIPVHHAFQQATANFDPQAARSNDVPTIHGFQIPQSTIPGQRSPMEHELHSSPRSRVAHNGHFQQNMPQMHAQPAMQPTMSANGIPDMRNTMSNMPQTPTNTQTQHMQQPSPMTGSSQMHNVSTPTNQSQEWQMPPNPTQQAVSQPQASSQEDDPGSDSNHVEPFPAFQEADQDSPSDFRAEDHAMLNNLQDDAWFMEAMMRLSQGDPAPMNGTQQPSVTADVDGSMGGYGVNGQQAQQPDVQQGYMDASLPPSGSPTGYNGGF
ncbi:uncharacterized protein K460DRAFT_363803 [Cucurbitaria berberidis CBS 394.84]|uniref:Uncharacterized protein n=1 Tax=Cucurbitaria berberidis CBS 394.84 TaxID=1168544 RepID=A0A9P4GK42_9PLEO|nr:uncharacterized protein K460DRAFT_363803 [Cucurbitaria berberidis CBS 394.84]KAF1847768.1 hypothetical protein K460DRAFT_363803 [Cucurbitaria berberidis CBS 394.84]